MNGMMTGNRQMEVSIQVCERECGHVNGQVSNQLVWPFSFLGKEGLPEKLLEVNLSKESYYTCIVSLDEPGK